MLFADTGSERPGALEHVARMQKWCAGWQEIHIVRWERVRGDVIGFEPLHDNCLRTGHLPSKAYGLAGCTDKWKIQPMDRWRKQHGFQKGAFAVGYDADEARRIKTACERGDQPEFTAWYPLVAWGIGRAGCQTICDSEGISVEKSSCFMCPNMKHHEWAELKAKHPELFNTAVEIEENAIRHGNFGRSGKGLYPGGLRMLMRRDSEPVASEVTEDRCHHGGCFT